MSVLLKFTTGKLLALALLLSLNTQAWAQLNVITVGGEPMYKSSGKIIKPGDKLDPSVEMIGGYGDSLLLWDGKTLQMLKIRPPQTKFSLKNIKPVVERKVRSIDNLEYIIANPTHQVCFITTRNKIKFKLGSYETQPPSGFMLSIRYEQNGKNPIKKRCELWGDSLIFARDNWKLPNWGDSLVGADLYHYEQKNSFYKLLGNVSLMQPTTAVKKLQQLRKVVGIKSKPKAKELVMKAFKWQYPLVVDSELAMIWNQIK